MKGAKAIIITGIVIIFFGTIFHFQGHGILGPESSFMYYNPDWVSYGIIISVIGAAILVGGIIMAKKLV